MTRLAQEKIERLRQLHRDAERELASLVRRRYPTPGELMRMRVLKKSKLLCKDRMARLAPAVAR
jgi:hypothetical protein